MKTIKLVITEKIASKRKVAHLSFTNENNLNAINYELYEELKKSLEVIREREDVGILIISSEVAKAFSSGVDVKFINTLTNAEASLFFTNLSILFNQLTQFPIPTIAVVNGYTFGAGADLALSCDLRIAMASTVFRFPGPQFGLVLGTQRLIHEVGSSTARMLTLLNKKVDAQTAEKYGLVHEVCKDSHDAHAMSLEWIETLQNVPLNTVQTIKGLGYDQKNFSYELTKKSVLHGDFQKRFNHYIKK
ncbi:enoyl-CoA hydratase/isomerase family protein [Niallia oryzisoli]|uniref:Enoyl-CoA hydratase/isomerase family protein n=1 Tax=Niallia oryzisoli TaxID=1737571 RepID=A0ABZ2C960_9BACI